MVSDLTDLLKKEFGGIEYSSQLFNRFLHLAIIADRPTLA